MHTQRLAQLVERKREVLVHLRTLGMRQLDLVAGDDWGRLTKVLSTKQRLLDMLSGIERELAPFRDEPPEVRVWASSAAREACRRNADECTSLLTEVMHLEREAERAMIRRRDETARLLAGMHVTAAAHSAYVADDRPASLGLDLVSEG